VLWCGELEKSGITCAGPVERKLPAIGDWWVL